MGWWYVLADILGRGMKGAASLYGFPVTLAMFHVAKSQHSFARHPSSLCSHWWWRLHRALPWPSEVFCALLCGRSPCLRLQRNAAAARLLNRATRKFLKTGFDFPNCLLGKRKDLGWGAESPRTKSASLGWEFGSSCSVCGMWLSWGSTCVSSCSLVVGVCSVVAVSPSVVSFIAVIDGGMKNLKESIRRWAFVFDFPPTSGCQQTILPCWWRIVDKTTLLYSHNMVGLEYNTLSVVQISIPGPQDGKFRA